MVPWRQREKKDNNELLVLVVLDLLLSSINSAHMSFFFTAYTFKSACLDIYVSTLQVRVRVRVAPCCYGNPEWTNLNTTLLSSYRRKAVLNSSLDMSAATLWGWDRKLNWGLTFGQSWMLDL